MTIQMNVIEQYIPVVLFIVLYKVLSFQRRPKSVTIQMKAEDLCFPVLVIIKLVCF